ncbi:hypothetical protein P692DRAFT_20887197 [Suillus brevipes Sb2]|nr:hypothetical protein P692DRAFT_20887197 [Suillus brevipes Sb2]
MRIYRLQGLDWMVSLHHNGLNSILADDMVCGIIILNGLASYSNYSKHYRDTLGLHLIVVPKSTLQNWLASSNDGRRM